MDGVHTYDFIAPRQIVFGWGRRHDAGAHARALGRRAWIVAGTRRVPQPHAEREEYGDQRPPQPLAQLQADLTAAGVESQLLGMLDHEPLVEDVDSLALVLRGQLQPGDFILGLGGGAVIDLAKAVAAMATNPAGAGVIDYLEGAGRGLALDRPPLPIVAMPTTAGTGAEATRNAVITSYDPPLKKSLRDSRLMPQIALVDPELCLTAPASVTAASGMDAITQLFESYISRKAKPIPQALAVQGLRLALPAMEQLARTAGQQEVTPETRAAREAMSHAALLSGMALANSGLGFAHGVAPALGVHCRVPHGVACALLLPAALRVNRSVREVELAHLSHMLFPAIATRSLGEAVEVLIDHVERLCDAMGVPRRLSQVGVRPEQIPELVRGARGASMSGNPRELSDAELTAILEELL